MSRSNVQREREIAERARSLFADSVVSIDDRTRSRLARARAAAVDAGARRPALFGGPRMLISAGALAAAVIAAALIWRLPEAPQGLDVPGVAEVAVTEPGDWELLLDGEELDLYEELDFYAWLLGQPEMRAVTDGDGSG